MSEVDDNSALPTRSANNLRFEARVHWLAKDVTFASEYEDAFAFDAAKGIASIADGVSGALFSKRWAELLTQGCIDSTPGTEGTDLADWLKPLRKQWQSEIDFSKLNFFQAAKLKQTGGAFATLLWVQYDFTQTGACIRATSIGDCCLFLVRDGKVMRSFPFDSSESFDLKPDQICSVGRAMDAEIPIACEEIEVRAEDVIVLATDAIALWYFQSQSTEQPVDWMDFWEMDEQTWTERIVEYRSIGMRHDDTTVLMFAIVGEDKLNQRSEAIEELPSNEQSKDTSLFWGLNE